MPHPLGDTYEILKLKDFPKFQNLKTLYFSTEDTYWSAKRQNVINTTDDYISLFANKKLENLKRLTCSSCAREINDEVMLAMAVGCPKLEYLDMYISATSVTDRGIMYLIRHCTNLRELDIHLTPEEKLKIMTERCQAEIKKYSPRLCITSG